MQEKLPHRNARMVTWKHTLGHKRWGAHSSPGVDKSSICLDHEWHQRHEDQRAHLRIFFFLLPLLGLGGGGGQQTHKHQND